MGGLEDHWICRFAWFRVNSVVRSGAWIFVMWGFGLNICLLFGIFLWCFSVCMCLSAERFDYLCLTVCIYVSEVVSASGSVCLSVFALLGNCGSCSSCGYFRNWVAFSWKWCCWVSFVVWSFQLSAALGLDLFGFILLSCDEGHFGSEFGICIVCALFWVWTIGCFCYAGC